MKNAVEIVTTDESGKEFTAETFLNYLRPSHPQWWEAEPKKWETHSGWVFRGVSDAENHHLLPSGLRQFSKDGTCKRRHLFESVRSIIEASYCAKKQNRSNPGNEHYIQRYEQDPIRLYYTCAIIEGIAQFHNALRDFGYNFEKPMTSLYLDKDSWHIYDHFHHFHSNINILTTSALAQHHGIPTFLLDWTRNPLIAAFFACESLESKNIAIWAFNTKNWKSFIAKHPNNPSLYNVFQDIGVFSTNSYDNHYLKAQKGVFTWVAGEYDKEQDRWLGADEILSKIEIENSQPIFLKKIILKKEYVSDYFLKTEPYYRIGLKTLIYREGITKASMMPTLDNIADTVKSRW